MWCSVFWIYIVHFDGPCCKMWLKEIWLEIKSTPVNVLDRYIISRQSSVKLILDVDDIMTNCASNKMTAGACWLNPERSGRLDGLVVSSIYNIHAAYSSGGLFKKRFPLCRTSLPEVFVCVREREREGERDVPRMRKTQTITLHFLFRRLLPLEHRQRKEENELFHSEGK